MLGFFCGLKWRGHPVDPDHGTQSALGVNPRDPEEKIGCKINSIGTDP